MKAVIALAVFAALFALAAARAQLLHADAERVIPDSYIVVFKEDLSIIVRDSHVRRVRGFAASNMKSFVIGKFAGYSAVLNNNTLAAVLNMPEVQYVEPDQIVTMQQACAVQTAAPSWGLDRIAEQDILLDGRYPYPATSLGAGVDAYIVDTGIYTAHSDFGGRATWGENFVDTNDDDCNGHGTHVAGTVGGTLYGAAKKVNLIAVKVLNCGGSGTLAGVIQGVQWVAAQHTANKRPSVANLSLGSSYSQAVNDAINAAVAAGVVMVVAAGNSNDDACNYSPASATAAISVGATAVGADNTGAPEDDRSSFSNYGTCVSVFAPGSMITSAWIGSTTAQNTISGTSMAAPHVAGVVSLILDADPTLAPADVLTIVENTANSGYINLLCSTAACRNSPNLIAFIGC